MVTEYGMSARLGAVRYGREQGDPFLGRSMGNQPDYSLEVAHEIDEEVRALIEAAHTEAWEILNTYRDVLDDLVFELLEKETLTRTDLERIFDQVEKRPRITAFNDFGGRTPSDKPPIQTPGRAGPGARRAVAARHRAGPRADARSAPTRVGANGLPQPGPNGGSPAPAPDGPPGGPGYRRSSRRTRRPGYRRTRPRTRAGPGPVAASRRVGAARPGTAASSPTRSRTTTGRRRTGGPATTPSGQSWPPDGQASGTPAPPQCPRLPAEPAPGGPAGRSGSR